MADAEEVTTWGEAEIARRMGADVRQAVAAVVALVGAGLLPHGVATVAAVAGSRWGIPPDEALLDLAGGRLLRGQPSAYELRTGAEEAEDEVDGLPAVSGPVLDREGWLAAGLPDARAPRSPHHTAPPG